MCSNGRMKKQLLACIAAMAVAGLATAGDRLARAQQFGDARKQRRQRGGHGKPVFIRLRLQQNDAMPRLLELR